MKTLLKRHDEKSIGLIGHTIVNYPSPSLCRESIEIMVEEGVSLIELQIPFSEPIADGPLFMAANHAALAAGVTLSEAYALMDEMTQRYDIPFIFMSYANIPYKHGYANFVKNAITVGAKGIIVPDLPLDNAPDFLKICQENEFVPIEVIPPNVTQTRLDTLLNYAEGFIYAVARSGVTGAKTEFDETLIHFLKNIRAKTELPIAVGFGIRTPQDIQFLKPYADYAIVGSHALRILQNEGTTSLRQFWRDLKKASANAV